MGSFKSELFPLFLDSSEFFKGFQVGKSPKEALKTSEKGQKWDFKDFC